MDINIISFTVWVLNLTSSDQSIRSKIFRSRSIFYSTCFLDGNSLRPNELHRTCTILTQWHPLSPVNPKFFIFRSYTFDPRLLPTSLPSFVTLDPETPWAWNGWPVYEIRKRLRRSKRSSIISVTLLTPVHRLFIAFQSSLNLLSSQRYTIFNQREIGSNEIDILE